MLCTPPKPEKASASKKRSRELLEEHRRQVQQRETGVLEEIGELQPDAGRDESMMPDHPVDSELGQLLQPVITFLFTRRAIFGFWARPTSVHSPPHARSIPMQASRRRPRRSWP